MENPIPSPNGSERNSWLTYFLMVALLVGAIVVLNLSGLRSEIKSTQPSTSAASEAIRTGDLSIRQALLPTGAANKRDAVNKAIDSYREAGSDPAALRRIGVAKESLLGRSGTPDFKKLAALDKDHGDESRMWREIYGSGPLPSGTANDYAGRIKELDLGPLRELAIADLYEKAGQTAKAKSTKETAKEEALVGMVLLGLVSMLLAAAGIAGLVLGGMFLTRYAKDLNTAPAPRIQPTVLLISFLVYMVCFVVLGLVFGVIGKGFGYSEESAVGVSVDLAMQLLAMFGSLALAIAAFRNMTAITQEDSAEIGLRFEPIASKLQWGLGAYCVALPLLGVTALISRMLSETVFRHIQTPEHPIVPMVAEGGLPLLMSLLVAVIAAPIVEETVFRGFLYTALRGKMGVWGAAALTSTIFAAVHPTIPGQFLPLFALAMVLALVREKTGSLLPSMVCHAANNLMTLLLVVLMT